MNLNTPRILWFAITSSVLLFAGVLAVVKLGGSIQQEPQNVLLFAFAGVSLLIAIGSFALPSTMYRQALAKKKLEIKEVPDETAMPTYREGGPTRRVFADPGGAKRAAMVSFFSPFIIGLAMSESVAIFGMVLGMTGHGWLAVAPFFVVSLILCGVRFPRESAITRPLETMHRARLG